MIITLNNNKGGVGKTTTSINIAVELAKKNKKVILIDLDPQANITTIFQGIAQKKKNEKKLIDLLKNKKTIKEVIDFDISEAFKKAIEEYSSEPAFALLHSSQEMIDLEKDVLSGEVDPNKLESTIKNLDKLFDFVIIDTPPAISYATKIALKSADLVIIPTKLDINSIEGVMNTTLAILKSHGNESKDIMILPTQVAKNATTRKNIETLRTFINNTKKENLRLFKNTISANQMSWISFQKYNLPQVLAPKNLKSNTKFVEEYTKITEEILDLGISDGPKQ